SSKTRPPADFGASAPSVKASIRPTAGRARANANSDARLIGRLPENSVGRRLGCWPLAGGVRRRRSAIIQAAFLGARRPSGDPLRPPVVLGASPLGISPSGRSSGSGAFQARVTRGGWRLQARCE